MGSTRCRHFVQNAWKKDLCSNCFKSRDEHAAAAPARPHPRQAIAPTPAAPPPQGILRGGAWTRTKSHRVCFPAEECEVIGEGGEDAGPPSDDDDDDDRVDWGTPVVEDDPQEQEEERLLQALTRSNTDFNSVAANLEASAPPPAASTPSKQRQQTTPLQLGRPQTDSQGRKQTLLVSVQPFGGPPGKSTGSPAKTAPAAAEHVTNIVLKSAPAPVPASKVPVPSSEVATPAVSSAAPSPSPTLLKLNDAQATPSKVAPPPLSSKHMFLKSIVEPASDAVVGTSVSVSAPVTTSTSVVSPPVKAPSPSPVPALSVVEASLCSSVSAVSSSVTAVTPTAAVVSSPVTATCPTVTAISSSPTKTTSGPTAASSTQAAKAVKTLVSSPKNVIVSAATTIPSSSTETSVSSTPTSNSPATTPSNPTRREGKRTHITRGTPISKNNELLLKTKLIPLRTSTILNNKRNSAGPEPPTLVKINGMRSEPVLLIESKQIDSSDEDDRTYSNVQVQSGSKRADENEAPPAPGTQTKRLSSLLAAAGTATGSPVGSREQAGEPDGRADPDSSSESGSEPPALPQSPPPAVDPRPSFLHGLTARLASAATPGPVLMDKPRVPFKSSAVQRWSQVCSASPTPPSPVKAADEPPHAPSCSPPCSPETSPTDSPLGSPHGTPPADGSNRAHKRQAPQPPQEPPAAVQLTLGGVFVAPASPPASPSPPQHPVKEPPAPSPSSASTSPTRPALGRSASTGSSVSASPPSPVLSYLRKASLPPGPSGQSPVARQKDKRRASQHVVAPLPPIAPVRSESVPSALGQVALGHSVTLGAHSGHSIAQALAQANSFVSMAPSPGSSQPQPSPRRGLSLSTDSLGPSPKHVLSYDTERKKPGTKVRFSLRKFLGLAKDGGALRPDGSSSVEGVPVDPAVPPQPRPRPRLEIIHPSDLSGRAVEVLRASGVEVRRQLQEQAAQQQQAQQAASPQRGTMDALSEAAPTACSPDPGSEAAKGRPSKPPPPPRSQSLESGDAHCSPSRPSRPPPPKSAHVDMMLRRHSASPASPPTACSPAFMAPGHSVYANVACVGGEMRPSVAPTKPLRTGSIRDANADGPRRTPLDMKDVKDMDSPSSQPPKMPVRTSSLTSQPEDSGYESVELSDSTQPQSMTDSDNVYECVNGVAERSSSPECDSSSKRSAPRSSCVSAQYCGSETESDIYSPYSFYGSDEGDDGEAESWKWRSRARKGRSVVHKSMEDNYDAVVGANLEALAQLLEQIRTGPTVPTALRPLKTASGLGWSDFEPRDAGCVLAGRWAFVPALWRGHAVTLAVLTVAKSGRAAHSLSAPAPFALLPIAEFTDRVPVAYLPERLAAASTQTVQASVSVLARARVDTLSTYGARLQALQGSAEAAEAEAAWREAGLSLLQLFNAFMALQALRLDAIVDPDSVVFLRDPSQEGIPQLAVLHGMGSATDSDSIATASRCRCALMGVRALLNGAPVTPVLASLLEVDEAAGGASDALAVAKAVLEYWLWGPAEAVSSLPALQRWLDLERATVLHRLVCARAAAGPHHRLAIPQQSHLLFLVHTTAPAMSRASRLLEDACVRPLEAAS